MKLLVEIDKQLFKEILPTKWPSWHFYLPRSSQFSVFSFVVPISEFEEEEEEEGGYPGGENEAEIEDPLDEYVSRLEPWQQEIAAEVDAELEKEQEGKWI